MTRTNLYNAPKTTITYPESDGVPTTNNTEYFHLLTTIQGNLEVLFANNPKVFVAGNLFWYPVEGNNAIRMAPAVMVALGRPKGKRGAYLQWREESVAPQVVFEILPHHKRRQAVIEKFAFYDRYGVEEFYLYEPTYGRLQGWLRNKQGLLASIETMNNWCSPRLDIHFTLSWSELELHYPDGSRFLSFVELHRCLDNAERRAMEAFLKIDEVETRAEQAEARVKELEEKLRTAGLL